MAFSAEQLLTRATVWLMEYPPTCALSGVMLMGKIEVNDLVPTAATNGRDEYYGRKFVDKLTEPEVRGLKLHEVFHKAKRDLVTWKHLYEKDPKLANKASDYVNNLMIWEIDPTQKYIKLPDGGLLDTRFKGMDTGEVFALLKQEKDNGQGNGNGEAGQGEGSGAGDQQEGFDEHDWEGSSALSDEEQRQLGEEIDQALRQGKMYAERLNGTLPHAIEAALTPEVRWEDELAEFVTSLCSGSDIPSFRKRNRRRMESEIIYPTMITERLGKLVVGIDTSGSIFCSGVLSSFMAALNNLCEVVRPESVDVLYWDSHVAGHETYDENSYAGLLTSASPEGGGGTEPQCVVDYMQQKNLRPDAVVMLTDGEVSSWGKGWTAPTLWCITDKRIKSEVGRSVHIKI
jgi:predicted metal-dependent peptidase